MVAWIPHISYFSFDFSATLNLREIFQFYTFDNYNSNSYYPATVDSKSIVFIIAQNLYPVIALHNSYTWRKKVTKANTRERSNSLSTVVVLSVLSLWSVGLSLLLVLIPSEFFLYIYYLVLLFVNRIIFLQDEITFSIFLLPTLFCCLWLI